MYIFSNLFGGVGEGVAHDKVLFSHDDKKIHIELGWLVLVWVGSVTVCSIYTHKCSVLP